MHSPVAKIVELVGISEIGVDDAIKSAIAKASETLENLQWFQVLETRGHIEDGKITRFQVILKVAFGLR
jgi:dodecin